MARDLLSQDMVTAQVSVITTEVPREFRDMVMEVTTRDLLSLVMVITMDMDNLMFTRTVIIIMDLTDMRLSMVTTRDLLSLVMVITMDMDNLTFTRTVIIIMNLMDMRLSMITRRDLLRLDMAMVVIATSMST